MPLHSTSRGSKPQQSRFSPPNRFVPATTSKKGSYPSAAATPDWRLVTARDVDRSGLVDGLAVISADSLVSTLNEFEYSYVLELLRWFQRTQERLGCDDDDDDEDWRNEADIHRDDEENSRYGPDEVLRRSLGLPSRYQHSLQYQLTPWRTIFQQWLRGLRDELGDKTLGTTLVFAELFLTRCYKSTMSTVSCGLDMTMALQLVTSQKAQKAASGGGGLNTSGALNASTGNASPHRQSLSPTLMASASSAQFGPRGNFTAQPPLVEPPQFSPTRASGSPGLVPHFLSTAAAVYVFERVLCPLFGPKYGPMAMLALHELCKCIYVSPPDFNSRTNRHGPTYVGIDATLTLPSILGAADESLVFVRPTFVTEFHREKHYLRVVREIHRKRDVVAERQDNLLNNAVLKMAKQTASRLFFAWRMHTQHARKLRNKFRATFISLSTTALTAEMIKRWRSVAHTVLIKKREGGDKVRDVDISGTSKARKTHQMLVMSTHALVVQKQTKQSMIEKAIIDNRRMTERQSTLDQGNRVIQRKIERIGQSFYDIIAQVMPPPDDSHSDLAAFGDLFRSFEGHSDSADNGTALSADDVGSMSLEDHQESLLHWVTEFSSKDAAVAGRNLHTLVSQFATSSNTNFNHGVLSRSLHLFPILRIMLSILAPPSQHAPSLVDGSAIAQQQQRGSVVNDGSGGGGYSFPISGSVSPVPAPDVPFGGAGPHQSAEDLLRRKSSVSMSFSGMFMNNSAVTMDMVAPELMSMAGEKGSDHHVTLSEAASANFHPAPNARRLTIKMQEITDEVQLEAEKRERRKRPSIVLLGDKDAEEEERRTNVANARKASLRNFSAIKEAASKIQQESGTVAEPESPSPKHRVRPTFDVDPISPTEVMGRLSPESQQQHGGFGTPGSAPRGSSSGMSPVPANMFPLTAEKDEQREERLKSVLRGIVDVTDVTTFAHFLIKLLNGKIVKPNVASTMKLLHTAVGRHMVRRSDAWRFFFLALLRVSQQGYACGAFKLAFPPRPAKFVSGGAPQPPLLPAAVRRKMTNTNEAGDPQSNNQSFDGNQSNNVSDADGASPTTETSEPPRARRKTHGHLTFSSSVLKNNSGTSNSPGADAHESANIFSAADMRSFLAERRRTRKQSGADRRARIAEEGCLRSLSELVDNAYYGSDFAAEAARVYQQYSSASPTVANSKIITTSFLYSKMRIIFGRDSSFWKPITATRQIESALMMEEYIVTIASQAHAMSPNDLCDRMIRSLDDTDFMYVAIGSEESQTIFEQHLGDLSVVFSLYATGDPPFFVVNKGGWMSMNQPLLDSVYTHQMAEETFERVVMRINNSNAIFRPDEDIIEKSAGKQDDAGGGDSPGLGQTLATMAASRAVMGGGGSGAVLNPDGSRKPIEVKYTIKDITERDGFDMDGLCHALSIVVLYKYPSPFVPLEKKIGPFLEKLFIPIVGAKVKDSSKHRGNKGVNMPSAEDTAALLTRVRQRNKGPGAK